jgi:hypothetical protein
MPGLRYCISRYVFSKVYTAIELMVDLPGTVRDQ